MKKEYCAFKTVVNNRLQEVWSRDKTHSLGKDNGCGNNLWLHQTFEGIDDIDWVPWIDIGSNRSCFEVRLVQGNRTKNKWGNTHIHGTGHVDIVCNKTKVYEFGFRDLSYGLARSQVLIAEMSEHPFKFSDPKSEIGRKIWFYRQAAVIDDLVLDQGCILIRKEDGTDFDISMPWDRECEEFEDWRRENIIKDDILSEHINWFRDGEQNK